MSDVAMPKNSSNTDQPKAQPKVEIDFTTDKIGQWAAKQESPFAKQNRERRAKQEKRENTRQKVSPYIIISASIAAVALAVFGLAMLIIHLVNQPITTETPVIAGDANQGVTNYSQNLLELFNNFSGTEEQKIQAVNQAVENTLSTGDGEEYQAQVRLAQTEFYSSQGMYEQVVSSGEAIDISQLSVMQECAYYSMLNVAYTEMGNEEKAREYFVLMYDCADKLQSAEGGYGE